MMLFTNPIFIAVFVVSALIVAVFYFYYQKRPPKKKKQPDKVINIDNKTDEIIDVETEEIVEVYSETEGIISVRMPDSVLGQIYDTEISENTALKIIREFGSLGRRWDRDGKKIYGINRYRDDKGVIKLRPIVVQTEMSHSPEELYNDLMQPEVKLAITEFAKADEKSVGDQIVKYLPWLLALGFLAFLWAFS